MKFKSFLPLLFTAIFSCQKHENEPKQEINIDSIAIKNVGSFQFFDSLTYVKGNNNELKIITKPKDVQIYYAFNDEEFSKLNEVWVTLSSSAKSLSFYAEGNGYYTTPIKKINFELASDTILNSIELFPIPCIDTINYNFYSNTRGELTYIIYSINGVKMLESSVLIYNSMFKSKIELSEFSAGLYLIRFDYGKISHTDN